MSCPITPTNPGLLGALVPKTGQTTSYASNDDGYYEAVVEWANPRFTDNSDGTVTDNLTGLIWLKDANCFGTRNWYDALSDSNGLEDLEVGDDCGLTDDSSAGDWRLPNENELHSLIDFEQYNPALPSGHPFVYVSTGSTIYWTSTTRYASGATHSWYVNMYAGDQSSDYKFVSYHVWPVRDPL